MPFPAWARAIGINTIDMKKILAITTLAAVLASVTSCEDPAPPTDGSRIGFAFSFFKKVNSVTPYGENVIVSPYSAGVALSMLELGAEGETKVEFDDALNATFYRSEDLGSNDKMTVESANSLWISDDFSVRNRYVETLEKDFDAFVGNRDFSKPSTVHEINNWCSENTNGKITEIIDRLNPDMALILVNALYFNAPWAKAFDPQLTHDDVFHGADGDVTVPMMFRKGSYKYAEFQGFQIVEIPYGGGTYAMYVVLPPAGMNVDSAVPFLGEGIYKTALGQLSFKEISLTMPKYKLSASLVLNEAFERMGIRDAFNSAADFGEISSSGKLQLDIVKQKCYIDVNEKGTEAAAVTGATIRMTSVTPETIMNVDRPFMFMIADNMNENVLFAGKIVNLD